MKILKSIFIVILSSLQTSSAFEYHITKGKCPYGPGDLKSTVKDTLDVHRISGPWINIFDRKAVIDEFKCYGVNFLPTSYGRDKKKVFNYVQSHGYLDFEHKKDIDGYEMS